MAMSALERHHRARVAALTMHATHDPRETTKAGAAAFMSKFDREADPDGTLEPQERARRGDLLRRAHFARMALAGAKKRRKKIAACERGANRSGADAAPLPGECQPALPCAARELPAEFASRSQPVKARRPVLRRAAR